MVGIFLICPLDPYWYLWVLFFYYAIFYYVERKNLNEKWIGVIAIAASLTGTIYLDPYLEGFRKFMLYMFPFYAGIYLAKHGFAGRRWKQAWAVCGAVSIASMFFVTYAQENMSLSDEMYIGIMAALAIALFIIFSVMRIPFLQESCFLRMCGIYSLEIYVLHNYITAANRLILPKLGITEFYSNVAINFFMAVMLPIWAGVLLRKTGLYPYVFKPGNLYKRENA